MPYRLRSFLKVNGQLLYLGLLTGAIVILFQVISLLVIYRYLKLDLYLCLVAAAALAVGWHLKNEPRDRPEDVSASVSSNDEKLLLPVSSTEITTQNPLTVLTSKEIVVLKLLAGTKTNKEIAGELFIEVSTVKTHINNIYSKLSISNRKEARLKYAGLVQIDSFS